MNMKWLMMGALVVAMGCAGFQTKTGPESEAFFDEAVVEKLQAGTSSRDEVVRLLGEPFITIPGEGGLEQYVYMHTYKRQLLVTFNGDTATGWEWSEKYATPVPPKQPAALPKPKPVRRPSGHNW